MEIIEQFYRLLIWLPFSIIECSSLHLDLSNGRLKRTLCIIVLIAWKNVKFAW